jgi:hypothetical protein
VQPNNYGKRVGPTPEYKNDERIERAMANGDDIFGREGHKFSYVDIDSSKDYDEDLKKILKDYPHLIKHTGSDGPKVCLNMIVLLLMLK